MDTRETRNHWKVREHKSEQELWVKSLYFFLTLWSVTRSFSCIAIKLTARRMTSASEKIFTGTFPSKKCCLCTLSWHTVTYKSSNDVTCDKWMNKDSWLYGEQCWHLKERALILLSVLRSRHQEFFMPQLKFTPKLSEGFLKHPSQIQSHE